MREGAQHGEEQAEGEAGSLLSKKPDVGLDPMVRGSRLEPKADACGSPLRSEVKTQSSILPLSKPSGAVRSKLTAGKDFILHSRDSVLWQQLLDHLKRL